MKAAWRREDIPYDAMGDYSGFQFCKEERAGLDAPVKKNGCA